MTLQPGHNTLARFQYFVPVVDAEADAIEMRRLSDGRYLALFEVPLERRLRAGGHREVIVETPQGERRMWVPRTELEPARPRHKRRYVLCINDDRTKDWWRELKRARWIEAGRRLFAEFREGDDDRRKGDRRSGRSRADVPRSDRRQGGRRQSDGLPPL